MKNAQFINRIIIASLACVSLSLSAITPAEKEKMMQAYRTQIGGLMAVAQQITFTQRGTTVETLKENILMDLEAIRNDLKVLAEGQQMLIENQQKIVENM